MRMTQTCERFQSRLFGKILWLQIATLAADGLTSTHSHEPGRASSLGSRVPPCARDRALSGQLSVPARTPPEHAPGPSPCWRNSRVSQRRKTGARSRSYFSERAIRISSSRQVSLKSSKGSKRPSRWKRWKVVKGAVRRAVHGDD